MPLPALATGEFFESYDEAWAYFLARDEPLESFWAELPDDPAARLLVWLIVPPDEVKARAHEIQASFRELSWIAPLPDHFFHVTVRVTRELDVGAASRVWADVAPFSILYRRANCFHDAVIVEADAEGVMDLVSRAFSGAHPPLLLPHMTIGYVRENEPADRLRDALRAFRDVDLGAGTADEVLLCDVPAGKSTFLQPWRVLGSVKLKTY